MDELMREAHNRVMYCATRLSILSDDLKEEGDTPIEAIVAYYKARELLDEASLIAKAVATSYTYEDPAKILPFLKLLKNED